MQTGIKKAALGIACLLGLGAYFEARSAHGLPEQSAPVTKERSIFPHGKPKHKTLDCSKCHTITPATIDVRQYPGHAACVSCHNLALEDILRPAAFCGICHEGRAVSKAEPALFKFPKPGAQSDFGIDFSHPSHLKPQTGDSARVNTPFNSGSPAPNCADCHKESERAGIAPEVTTATGHPACFICHGEKPVASPGMFECAGCHKLGGPKYPRLYGTVKDFRHSDHVFDTRPVKKADARAPRASDYLCSQCHVAAASAASLDRIRLPQAEYCRQCHNGKIGLPGELSRDVEDSLKKR